MTLLKQTHALRALSAAALCLIGAVHAHGQAASEASFIAHRDFFAGPQPSDIAHADFNGDGIEDLVVPNAIQSSTVISVLLGNRDGSFQPPVFVSTGGQAPGAVAA